MELRDVLKIHGKLRRYCTSSVERSETREVQYLLNAPCIFNTSLDSMLYLLSNGQMQGADAIHYPENLTSLVHINDSIQKTVFLLI